MKTRTVVVIGSLFIAATLYANILMAPWFHEVAMWRWTLARVKVEEGVIIARPVIKYMTGEELVDLYFSDTTPGRVTPPREQLLEGLLGLYLARVPYKTVIWVRSDIKGRAEIIVHEMVHYILEQWQGPAAPFFGGSTFREMYARMIGEEYAKLIK